MAVSRADKRMPPGFRFHPTDEELVMYYLKRKIMGKRLCYDVISELDIYQHAPWDLPEFAILQTGDLNWYFFCPCKKKHASSGKTNRATESGYWKATGNDRVVHYKDRMVGKIKTLVFHWGKPPKGERMDWVMHEFRLDDSELTGVAQDAYVICRIFKKSGLGPKNGEQYGAPFREEDWEGDDDDDNNQIQGGAAFALFSGGHSVGNNLENSANLGHVNQIGSVTSLSEQVSDAIQGGASFVPLAGGHSVGNIQESSDMTANLGHDNHSGFVTSMSEQALDGNYLLPSADDGLTKPNASDNLILTINEPQGQSQSPVILFYDNNVDVEELLALFDDDAGNAGMPAQGITETDPQIADVNGDDIFGDLQSLDEFQYSSHFTPGYAAQSFRLDGDFLEEKDLDEDQL